MHTPDQTGWARKHLGQAVAAGVTTVLCMGTTPETANVMKAEANRRFDLADLRSSGWCATAPGGHPTQWGDESYPTIATVEEAASFVAARHDEGMDYLKLVIEDSVGRPCPSLSPELTEALVKAAHAHGILAVVHVSKRWHAEQAIDAGVDGLAHQYGDEEVTADVAQRLAAQGMFVVLTLATAHAYECPGLAADPRLEPYIEPAARAYMASGQLEHVGRVGGPSPKARRMLAAVGRLRDAGVTLLAGTDSPGIGAVGPTLHLELDLLVRGGLTPTQALTAATSATADRFGLHDRGRIRPGLRADMILLDEDPTTNIDATRSITRIWRGGQEFDRDGYRQAVQQRTALWHLEN